ncbi:hypothetical protein [Qipengyuania gelatinilytica]|uniref:DUF2631 domain-containing protein n=1 Tax=Qipengyuania gelatinilytica TaxID=2867231 RepID=A0ABX9A5N3_9SPHN|nr:hypothetical protein [Qipengyuania gelatinilytica]QZD96414.1 hypothetical protein K3136_06985 [Qipengyuania gelatinilytica]
MSDEKGWFAPKKFGYGSGLPTAWQGWAVLLGYVATAVVAGLMWESGDEVYTVAGAAIFLVATIAFMLVAKATTPGGWKWRPRKGD